MEVIGIVNHKGGTAKTTVAKLLTEYFASKNKKVLGIDIDAQCNYSARLINMEATRSKGLIPPIHPDYEESEDEDWDGRDSVADLLLYGEVAPYPTHLKNVEIIPSHGEDLEKLIIDLDRSKIASKIVPIIKEWTNLDDVKNNYDVCIIDTPPSKSVLTEAVIHASTHIVIPSVMEELSIEGLFSMIGYFKMENYGRNEDDLLKIAGILPTLFDGRTKDHADMLSRLKDHETIREHIIDIPMHRRVAYNRSNNHDAQPKSILGLAKKSTAYEEALKICSEIDRRVYG